MPKYCSWISCSVQFVAALLVATTAAFSTTHLEVPNATNCLWRLLESRERWSPTPADNFAATRSDVIRGTSPISIDTTSYARRYFVQSSALRPAIVLRYWQDNSLSVSSGEAGRNWTLSTVLQSQSDSVSISWADTGDVVSCNATMMSSDAQVRYATCANEYNSVVCASQLATVTTSGMLTISHDVGTFLRGPCLSSSVFEAVSHDRSRATIVAPQGVSFRTMPMMDVGVIIQGDTQTEGALHLFTLSGLPRLFAGRYEYLITGDDGGINSNLQSASLSATLSAPNDTVRCSIADSLTYDVKRLATGVEMLSASLGSCLVYGTVSELHHACDADALCVGYTTNYANPDDPCGDLQDYPLCLVYEGNVVSDLWADSPRLLHTKPRRDSRLCPFHITAPPPPPPPAANSALLNDVLFVWIGLTAMESSIAKVFVDEVRIATCGGPMHPFYDKSFGVNGQCDAYVLCTMLNSSLFNGGRQVTIEFLPTGVFPSTYGCDDTFSAFVSRGNVPLSAVVANPTASLAPESVPPNASSPLNQVLAALPNNGRWSASDLVSNLQLVAVKSTTVWIVVSDALAVYLEVSQTAFAAGKANRTIHVSGDPITASNGMGDRTAACGSDPTLPFAGGQTGISDHCHVHYGCGPLLLAANMSSPASARATLYSGFVSVTLSPELLASSIDKCGMLSITVHVFGVASPTPVARTAWREFGFPLGSSSDQFVPLIALGNGNPSTYRISENVSLQVQTALFNATMDFSQAGATLTSVIVVPAFDNKSWAKIPTRLATDYHQYLHPNATYGFFMDQFSNGGATFFYIPQESNHVRVRIAQTFVKRTDKLSLIFWIGYTVASVVECYSDERYITNTEGCDLTQECLSMQLDQGYDSFTILVNRDVTNTPCLYNAVMTLEFSKIAAVAANVSSCSNGWFCQTERKCLALDRLCDGIVDCSGAKDESVCSKWTLVEQGSMLSSTFIISSISVSSVWDCKIMAIVNGSVNGFAYNTTDRKCHLLRVPLNVIASPFASLSTASTSVALYLSLDFTLSAPYGGCSRQYSCSGHGNATWFASMKRCDCQCDAMYGGLNCSLLSALGTVNAFLFAFDVTTSASPPTPLSAASLCYVITKTLGSSLVSCSCSAPIRPSVTSALVECQIHEAPTLTAQNPYVVAAVEALRSEVTKLTPSWNLTTVSRESLQAFVRVAGCSMTGPTSMTCTPQGAVGRPNTTSLFRMIRASVVTDTEIGSARLSIDGVDVPCHLFTSVVEGCLLTTCTAEPTFAPFSLRTVSVNVTLSGTSRPLTEQYCYSSNSFVIDAFTYVPMPTVRNISATSPDAIRMTDSSIKPPLLICGAALLSLGGLMTLAGAVMLFVDYLKSLDIAASARREPSRVTELLRRLFTQLQFYDRTPGRFRHEHWGLVGCVVGYNVIVAGVLFLLISLLLTPTANYLVALESYPSSMCSMDPYASNPTTLLITNPEYQCGAFGSSGKGGFDARVASGLCEYDANGVLWATITWGSTSLECGSSAVPIRVRNGTCMRGPSFLRDPYLLVMCGLSDDISARLAFMKSIAGSVMTIQPSGVSARSPSAILSPYLLTDTPRRVEPVALTLGSSKDNRIVTTRPFLKGSAVLRSTSFDVGSIAAVASRHLLFADEQGGSTRLVYQTDDTFQATSATDVAIRGHPEVDSLWRALSGSDMPNVAAYVPAFQDLPVGFIFNDFNVTGASFDPSRKLIRAQRYYNIEKTPLDIGYYYGPDTSSDGYGFTISFYTKLQPTTEGFIFVSTDALEGQDMSSPLVDTLFEMESQFLSGEEWYPTDFHVYCALYVSGPAGRMHLVMADPKQAKKSIFDVTGNTTRFTRVAWDLVKLDLMQLFNQEWHQVAVVFKNENNQVKARLFIDGNSDEDFHWNKCLLRRPSAVAKIVAGQVTGSVSPGYDVLYTGGALYVGLLQGGVSNLLFEPMPLSTIAIIMRGTETSQMRHDLSREKIFTISIVLFVFATLMLIFTLCGSGYAVSVDRKGIGEADAEAAVTVYVGITRLIVRDERKKQFTRLSFDSAKRWMGLTTSQFVLFLHELKEGHKYPHREMIRVLFTMRRAFAEKVPPNFKHMDVPTPEAWQALVDEDRAHPKPPQKERFFEPAFDPSAHDDILHPIEKAMRLEAPIYEYEFVKAREDRDAMGGGVLGGDLGQAAAETNMRTQGATYVDLGGGFGKARDGTSGLAGDRALAGQGNTGGMTAELYNFFMPVIASMQTVYIWLSNVPIPGDYNNTFGQFFSAFAIDIARLVTTLQAYATPILQLVAGLFIVGGLYYFCAVDNKMFEWYLARYALRRDQLEGRSRHQHRTKETATLKPDKNHSAADDNSDVQRLRDTARGKKRKKLASIDSKPAKDPKVVASETPAEDTQQSRFRIPDVSSPVYAYSLVESDFLKKLENPFDDTVPCDLVYEVEVLPMSECQRIDQFVGLFEHEDCLDQAESLRVHDNSGTSLTLLKHALATTDHRPDLSSMPLDERIESHKAVNLWIQCEEADVSSRLEVLGCFCRRHRSRRLTPLVQTEVWPFENPPTCCVVANGVPCGERSGVIFSCGMIEKTAAGVGDKFSCDYAICARHYRGGVKDAVFSKFVGVVRQIQERGWSWAFAVVFVTLGNSAYMPFMRTALMIISCNPYFQCTFACWDEPNLIFILAVFLCLTMLCFFGVGIPLIQVSLLRFRRNKLYAIFLADEYGGRYEEHEEDDIEPLEQMKFGEVFFGIFTGKSVASILDYFERKAEKSKMMMSSVINEASPNDDRDDADLRETAKSSSVHVPKEDDVVAQFFEGGDDRAVAAAAISAGDYEELASDGPVSPALGLGYDTNGSQAPSPQQKGLSGAVTVGNVLPSTTSSAEPTVKPVPVVALKEWSRFLATDPTALAVMYNMMELRWMHMTPILLMFKVVIVSQVVFLPSGSLAQRTGMAIVEILFAALVFFTAPFTSPVVDAMYRFASIHQLYLLALQNLDTVRQIDGQGTLSMLMLGTSALYMLVCVSIIMVMTVWPAVQGVLDKEESRKLLKKLGLQYSGTTNLYVTPVEGRGVRVKKVENAIAAAGTVVANAAATVSGAPVEQRANNPLVPL